MSEPEGENLTGSIRRTSSFSIGSGKLTEVHLGKTRIGDDSVVIKFLRRKIDREDPDKICQCALEAMRAFSTLNHPNIVPYLGYCNQGADFPSLAIVSPYYRNGTILEYISNTITDGLGATLLLTHVSEGLKYLHGRSIVHGDFHHGNVLIDDNGRALLSDVGRCTVLGRGGYGTKYLAGDSMYLAPELISDAYSTTSPAGPTEKADVYAFGILVFRILTRKPPFPLAADHVILNAVINGAKPDRALDEDDNISAALWYGISGCWNAAPTDRPNMTQISMLL